MCKQSRDGAPELPLENRQKLEGELALYTGLLSIQCRGHGESAYPSIYRAIFRLCEETLYDGLHEWSVLVRFIHNMREVPLGLRYQLAYA